MLSQLVLLAGLPVERAMKMEPFLAVLYIHVIATLGLVAALGAEALALRRLGREPASPADPILGMRLAASLCLAILFFSGGYLTDHVGLWKMAWPKIAVAIIVAFGTLAGLSARRMRKIHQAYAQSELPNGNAVRKLQGPLLKASLSIRAGLVLAAVWLMTAKPDFIGSLASVLVLVIISWGLGALINSGAQRHPAASVGREFDTPSR